MGFSALYLTVALHRSTGQKANTCLATWHVVNSVLLSLMVALKYIYWRRKVMAGEDNYY